MPLTLLDILKRVRFYTGDSPASSDVFENTDRAYEAGLISLIGDAIRELEGYIRQSHENYFLTSATITTVSGTSEYSLPTDHVNTKYIERVKTEGGTALDNPVKLYPMQRLEEKIGYRARGIPNAYLILGSTVMLVPTPDFSVAACFKHWYTKRITLPTALTGTTEIPDDWIEIVGVSTAIRTKYRTKQDVRDLQAFKDSLLINYIRGMEDRQLQEPRYVRYIPDSTRFFRTNW